MGSRSDNDCRSGCDLRKNESDLRAYWGLGMTQKTKTKLALITLFVAVGLLSWKVYELVMGQPGAIKDLGMVALMVGLAIQGYRVQIRK